MATSLQQQLAAIAAKSTHQLNLQAQKAQHSESLLFPSRDAASQSFDTIYQLCLEGFEELCQLDVRFVPFARSLFSEQSKSEDRTQMTAKENAHLDALIVRFLGLLGGRLLLKPAVKAAEWLIRRFRVHEYNTEAVLLTFLPYHQSPIFLTLLSLLPDRLPPSFRFLHPYVSSRQNPPRHAIVVAASNNFAIFEAFSRYVLNVARAKHQSTLLLGFWASVTAQAVNGMIDASRSGRDIVTKQKEEDMLLKVLPVLQDALSIQGVPELYLGSCMIMTILATKCSLSDKVLEAMMEAVATGWTEQTADDGIICLAVLAEEKEELSPLSRPIIRALLSRDNVLSTMERIATKCRVRKLSLIASFGVLDGKLDARGAQFLTAMLETQILSEVDKVGVLQAMFREPTFRDTDDANSDLSRILSSLAEQEKGLQLISIAAQQADVDLARINSNLVLQLTSSGADESVEEQEPMEIGSEADESRPKLSFNDLPKLPSNQTSFLALDQDALFTAYSRSFRQAMPSPADVSTFLELLSTSQMTCLTSPALLSFLARVWSCDAYPTSRVLALRAAAGELQRAGEGQPIDMQSLLPYVLTALCDPNKAVRSAAAPISIAMANALRISGKNGKSEGDVDVWAKDTIYGNESSKLHVLSTSDTRKLLDEIIIPVLEDCVMNSSYIAAILSDAISPTSAANKTNKNELKPASRTSIYAYLVSHTIGTPFEEVKIRLLSVLSKAGKVGGATRVQLLLNYIRTYIEQSAGQPPAAINMALCKALVGCLTHRSIEEIEFLKDLASGQVGSASIPKLGFDRLQRLWTLMSEPTQASTVDWMLDLSFTSGIDEDVQSEAIETIRNLPLLTSVLVHLVENLPTVHELQGQPNPAKKQRTSRVSETLKSGSVDKEKLSAAIRRITAVLELVEASKPERHPQLLKGLFHLLSELHHYKTVLDSDLIYLQSLLVNSLLSVVNGLKLASNKGIDPSVIRPDLIVDCVRSTSNTQVHQSALLLMSALASWAPDLVLHSVMPLFTFMGSTILKQGDDYSAHVTDQTVARIIPPLAASLKKRGRDLITGAADLLLSFTAAFEHIPLHRRPGLFQHLVQTLGPEEALFAVVAMLVERYSDEDSVRPFVAQLMGNFPAEVQLLAVQQYMDLTFDTLKPKPTLSNTILGFSEKTREQATEATSTLLDGLTGILAGDSLRKKLAQELKGNDNHAETLRVTYSVVLEKTMQLGLQLKSDKTLGRCVDDLLTSVLGLMPSKDFIDSSAKLMQTGSDEIRQQVFLSLEQRVQTAKRGDTALQHVFIEVLPNCVIFVTAGQPVDTRLAAIACIDRIADKFGKTNRPAVKQAAQQLCGVSALGSNDSSLRRMSLLCLASMVEVLEDEFIAILPQTLETALTHLQETLDADNINKPLLAACFSFATAVLDYIPWMLSGSYLDRFLLHATEVDQENARHFSDLAARKIAVQEIVPAIERTWQDVVHLGADSAKLHLTTLRSVIRHQPKSVIAKNAQSLFAVLLNAFDLRHALCDSEDDDNDGNEVFNLVNETTMNAVLKLNDTTFRPFFIRLSEWTGMGLSKKEKASRVFRQISFYSFVLVLFDQLKSLVTTYVAYILDDVVSILRRSQNTEDADVELLDLVVQALSSNFREDQDGFWQSPAHFDVIVGPLMDLLKQASTVGVEKHIVPAIVELASAAHSPEHLKTIDDKLQTFMRHEDAAVRLVSVKAERSLTERLSFDWCNFIPTWLPLIAELQEDDDGTVERETLRWMEQIQRVTGESVNEMLR